MKHHGFESMPEITPLDKMRLPFGGQEIEFQHLTHESGGVPFLRIRIRENKRFTIFDVDPPSGQQKKARALAWALGLFFGFVLFNLAVNLEIIRFVHLSDFGFISILVMMDREIMLESRDQNRRMRAVLDHLPSAICLKDLQGRIQLINRGFETLFHVNQPDILGKADSDLFPGEQARRFRADETRAVETRQEVANEHVLAWDGAQHIYQA